MVSGRRPWLRGRGGRDVGRGDDLFDLGHQELAHQNGHGHDFASLPGDDVGRALDLPALLGVHRDPDLILLAERFHGS